ncbi:MAG: hypothetical protein K2H45_10780 [Acetatifactor sp.]|nr:hypothetical protein [Acetatifactor sp.]
MGNYEGRTGGYMSAPRGMPPVKKPIFNVFLWVFLPFLVVLTILVLFLTYVGCWKANNDVSEEDKAVSDSDTLIKRIVLQAEDDEKYYEVYELQTTSEYIAFCVSQEQLDEIPCMGGSYYPVAYWHGPSRIMDLSQSFKTIKEVYYSADGADYQTPLTQIRVYDFSAYRGHTQPMGRGGGIAVAFFWLAELFIGGILIILDLIVGMVIFGINWSRKKARK